MGGQRVSAPEEGDQGVVPDGGRCMAGWGVTYAVSTARPEPQAAQGAPRLAVAGLEDCVYLSVAALQEGTAALRRWRARPSHLHGPQHRGRLGPGARDRPRQPRPGGRGRDSQDLAAVATAVAQCAAFWAAAPTFAIQPAPL